MTARGTLARRALLLALALLPAQARAAAGQAISGLVTIQLRAHVAPGARLEPAAPGAAPLPYVVRMNARHRIEIREPGGRVVWAAERGAGPVPLDAVRDAMPQAKQGVVIYVVVAPDI